MHILTYLGVYSLTRFFSDLYQSLSQKRNIPLLRSRSILRLSLFLLYAYHLQPSKEIFYCGCFDIFFLLCIIVIYDKTFVTHHVLRYYHLLFQRIIKRIRRHLIHVKQFFRNSP